MLNRIKNSILAGKNRLKVPFAKFDYEVAQALVKAGYLESAEKKGRSIKKIIDINIKLDDNGNPKVSDIKLISKPSHKAYKGYSDLRRSKHGYGDYFMTTSKGIMTTIEARKAKVGGELLFEIW
ncbi:MAG: 30S ribosomal protein S8 [Candidatus Colwellbacteria bacterium]|jgi:small subunit ribosomal protein S8|nr:30S ribosomal protein S8 [Candidatus Colwellbacteria bacterium]MCK9497454.1 30S ribosomal protein S8 [Candidatus Colwellbacteria bacterium]MDD3752532.1 30S ribosomal protein S8 [Candidatus Colwellbacteria bacterium]MDD4818784.1 30S ribosomal protein S8 [Candidatus Colwellbacteria bacterium]